MRLREIKHLNIYMCMCYCINKKILSVSLCVSDISCPAQLEVIAQSQKGLVGPLNFDSKIHRNFPCFVAFEELIKVPEPDYLCLQQFEMYYR